MRHVQLDDDDALVEEADKHGEGEEGGVEEEVRGTGDDEEALGGILDSPEMHAKRIALKHRMHLISTHSATGMHNSCGVLDSCSLHNALRE
jgi:hypothetical protein